ncbi:MAG: hypothetical protein IKK21_08195 [Clostridia bacterium]|nr:hypothetical protein [Clostridia bacterium]
MKTFFYRLCQCTWGLPQTLLGALVFLLHLRDRHFSYHGAIVTQWQGKTSVALGMFVFITAEPFFYDKLKDDYTMAEMSARLLVHEYGHTIQSLILGPLYLIVMGIPSTLWAFLPACLRKRQQGVSYFAFFTERWANALGERVTGTPSMEQLLID